MKNVLICLSYVEFLAPAENERVYQLIGNTEYRDFSDSVILTLEKTNILILKANTVSIAVFVIVMRNLMIFFAS